MNFTNEVASSTYDIRDYQINAATDLPETYQLEILPKVKNQGSKPTCVAHAASSLIEYFHQKEHNEYRIFSTEFIYGLRDITYFIGDGMRLRDALKTLAEYGDPFNVECPGNHDYSAAMNNINSKLEEYLVAAEPHKIECYYKCQTKDEIKTAIMTHGPVLASMNTYKNAKLVNDVYTFTAKGDRGRHCVLIYGWDKDNWLIQNSWGILWGGDGRFKLPQSTYLNETWGVSDKKDPENIIYPSAFKIWIHKFWNAIVNFFTKKK